MTLKTQAKVLRALQEQKVEPVGGAASVAVDVRVIAATNKNLEEELRKGSFREDLYFRLNVIPFQVPPLRERREDIPALARHFVAMVAGEYGKRAKELSPRAIEVLAGPALARERARAAEHRGARLHHDAPRPDRARGPARAPCSRPALTAGSAVGREAASGFPFAGRGARRLREAIRLEQVPGVRRQHEPHRRGVAGRAVEPLPQDEGLRAHSRPARRGGVTAHEDARAGPRPRWSRSMHLWFLVLEMFLWTRPLGLRMFRQSLEKARASATLAANQGLYNGFLAAGLVWGLLAGTPEPALSIQVFFLTCVVVAAVFGAATVSRSILVVQGLPAALALLAFVAFAGLAARYSVSAILRSRICERSKPSRRRK